MASQEPDRQTCFPRRELAKRMRDPHGLEDLAEHDWMPGPESEEEDTADPSFEQHMLDGNGNLTSMPEDVYEYISQDGAITRVKGAMRNPAYYDQGGLYEQAIRADPSFDEVTWRRGARFGLLVKSAKSSAKTRNQDVLRFVDSGKLTEGTRYEFVPCKNGLCESTRAPRVGQKTMKRAEGELEMRQACDCSVCVSRKEFEVYSAAAQKRFQERLAEKRKARREAEVAEAAAAALMVHSGADVPTHAMATSEL